jgi:hypothetical protein
MLNLFKGLGALSIGALVFSFAFLPTGAQVNGDPSATGSGVLNFIISGNGASSSNTINATIRHRVRINQRNDARVRNNITSVNNTGFNNVSGNTGSGSATITTGNSASTVTVTNNVNTGNSISW